MHPRLLKKKNYFLVNHEIVMHNDKHKTNLYRQADTVSRLTVSMNKK